MSENADTTVEQTDAEITADATDEPKFSQAHVDKMMKHRVGEALAKQRQQFAGYDDLKQKAEEFDRLQEANKTELEKAQSRAAELEKQAADATRREQEALLRSAVVAEAARKNVIDPEAAFALLDRSTLGIDSDGNPTNVADAMESLLTGKPWLLAPTGQRPRADLGARGGSEPQITREQLASMSPADVIKADNEGRLAHLMGGEGTYG